MEKSLEYTIKNFRGKAVKGFAVFLLIMLFCTFVSRSIYAYQMPRVETDKAQRKSISHVVAADGCVAAVSESAVTVPAGIRIAEIFVRAGEEVEQGTVLFRLDTECLTADAETLEDEIALSEQKLTEKKSDLKIAEQARQTERARAKEDLENVTKTQDLNVGQARRRYELAKNEMTACDPEDEGRYALEKAFIEAEMSLQSADNERSLAILEAQRRVEDADRAVTNEKSSIMEAEQELEELRAELAVYRELIAQNGEVFSGIAGSVSSVQISVGEKTTDGAAMKLADGSGGWVFEACVAKEQMGYFHSDDSVTLKFQNGKNAMENCPVLAINQIDDDNYLVTVKIQEGKVSMGETGTLQIFAQEGPYECCVPLSAIHTSDGISYVFVIREIDTILGTELKIVKRTVSIIDKNDTYAALKEGSLGEEEQVVVDSDKEIAPGDTVRPMETVY